MSLADRARLDLSLTETVLVEEPLQRLEHQERWTVIGGRRPHACGRCRLGRWSCSSPQRYPTPATSADLGWPGEEPVSTGHRSVRRVKPKDAEHNRNLLSAQVSQATMPRTRKLFCTLLAVDARGRRGGSRRSAGLPRPDHLLRGFQPAVEPGHAPACARAAAVRSA